MLAVLTGQVPPELTVHADLDVVATTNLFYARLCRAVASPRRSGRLVGDLTADAPAAISAVLQLLPREIVITPMRELAWPMAQLAASYRGLSLLGTEAVAAAVHLDATLCVRDRNNGPGIRAAAEAMGVPYVTISS